MYFHCSAINLLSQIFYLQRSAVKLGNFLEQALIKIDYIFVNITNDSCEKCDVFVNEMFSSVFPPRSVPTPDFPCRLSEVNAILILFFFSSGKIVIM